MGYTKQEQALKILESHPEGICIEGLQEKLGYDKVKGARNLICLLKKKGHMIEKYRNLYRLVSKNVETTKQNKTQFDNIIEALNTSEDGLTTEEISNVLCIDEVRIPNRIYYLRKKGYEITFNSGVYRLHNRITQPQKKPEQKFIQHVNPPQNKTYKLIPAEYREAFLSLSDSDKSDCIDMIRKSVYYNKSAIALLESNKIMLEFVEAIERGI